jgi:hypothetical protein
MAKRGDSSDHKAEYSDLARKFCMLGAVECAYAIVLERKDDMRRRSLVSSDDADTLALSFAHPVPLPGPVEGRRHEEKLRLLKRRIV